MADLSFPSSSAPIAASSHRPFMSITLPRNFAPMGLGSCDEPRTPEQTFAELNLPPPPHHSTMRLRRSRINMDGFQARNNALPPALFASDIPIPSSVLSDRREMSLPATSFIADEPMPSVELPSLFSRPTFHHSITEPSPRQHLQIPSYREQPPRTPPAQTKPVQAEFKPGAWDMIRESSVDSICSEESFSSGEAYTTRPTSFNGSVTSPELDPFAPRNKINIIPDTPSRPSKKARRNVVVSQDGTRWTTEMDNHLWNMYQMYLGDPTVTPFKTVPGSIPPTGVCHRVARKAKEMWPQASKVSRPIVKRYKLRNVMDEKYAVRDKTPEPNDFLRHRDLTPTNGQPSEAREAWPLESATRKRLKQLSRDKFSLSAHYQRLRESRSPSPFAALSSSPQCARITRSTARQMSGLQSSSTTYATRELGISLVASGATAPLAQLVTGDSPPNPQNSDDWFNTPISLSSPDGNNSSPPSGLGIDTSSLAPASDIPRLASPFTYSTWNGPTRSTRGHRREISQNQFDTVHATGPRLLSPVHFGPDTSSNANKRRAMHNLEDELSPNGSALEKTESVHELLFTGSGDISQRRIRLRNRGATLGAAVSNQERLDRLFTPPATLQQLESTSTKPPSSGLSLPPLPPRAHPASSQPGSSPIAASSSSLPAATLNVGTLSSSSCSSSSTLAPPADAFDSAQKRLGSPFELDPNKRSNRARSPRHIATMSDPFIGTTNFHSAGGALADAGMSSTGNERNDSSNSNKTPNPFTSLSNSTQSIGERLAMFTRLHHERQLGGGI